MPRPSSTAASMVAKLSSVSTHRRRFLGDVGAAQPHGDADVGLLQRRGVVHAVAGHRHHLALRLQGAHQAQLLFGFDAGRRR
jgi:hypothetical protein